ncbi:MAG: anaerobic sulfatase maturase [Clostridia bacterium]
MSKKFMTILMKPASSLCNLNCKYCFYNDTAKNRETASFGIMSEGTVNAIIEKSLEYVDGGGVNYSFQGGEPTVAGLDFFKKFVEIVNAKNLNKTAVTYALQTNGTLLDDAFCEFFKTNNFLIGISIDGKSETHNANRLYKDGKGTFNKVMQAVDCLKKHKVEFNVLTVVNSKSKKKAKETYNFFVSHGINYLQFITCLEPIGSLPFSSGFAIDNDGYFEYYKTLLDLYVADKRNGKDVSIRYFDNLLGMLNGENPELCGMNGHCNCQLVIEGNGNCYPCDFYCEDKYLLGNINADDLTEMATSENAKAFLTPSYQIDEKCKTCAVANLCRGGCRRERDYFSDGKLNLNIYCEGRKKFFEYLTTLLR